MAAKEGVAPAERKVSICWAILLWGIAIIVCGVVGWDLYQGKAKSEEAVRLGQQKIAGLETDVAKIQSDLKACMARPPCKKEVSHKKKYRIPRRPIVAAKPAPVPVAPAARREVSHESVPTATQVAAACSPLPIISDGDGGWKCAQPVKEGRVVEAPPQPKPIPQVPSGCFRDQSGQLMCPANVAEEDRGSSWVPWAIGGAAVLAIVAKNRHHHDPSPAPAVTTPPVTQPPVFVTNPGVSQTPLPTFATNPGSSMAPPVFVTN